MLALFAGFLLASQSEAPLVAGDHWTVERTYRFLNEAEAIDFTQVERTEYTVDSADAKGFVLKASRRLTETRFGADGVKSQVDPRVFKVKLGPGGTPPADLESEDGIRSRVDRMQWAAAEDRQGVSWTRRFTLSAAVPASKVTLKPTMLANGDRSVAITYDEGEVRGEGVAVVGGVKRFTKSLKLTLTGVYPPGGDKLVKVAVNQMLVVGA